MIWIKRTLLVLLAIALLGALVMAFRPQPVLVEVAEVTRGPFEQVIEDDGITRVRERYVVSAPLAGKLQRITLKAGDAVAAGMVLAIIDPGSPALLDMRTERELTERVGVAEANRLRAASTTERTRATLDKSRSDLERTRKLAAKDFVSAAQLEQVELEARISLRELEATRYAEQAAIHDVAVARAALLQVRDDATGKPAGKPSARRWEVRTPVAGQILRVTQESETTVAVGAPLLEVGQPAELEVVVDVLSTDAVQIKPGAPVRLLRWGKAEPLDGRIRRVEPAAFTKVSALGVEEQRVYAVIDLTSPAEKWQSLGDGYKVDASIIVAHLDNVIKVPVSALFRDGEQWAVFTVANGKAARRTVQLGRRGGLEAVVEKGLQPGEKIIVHPGDTLRDGLRIKVTASPDIL
ncbi:MAG: efflux RND transporter periplasmic adaptor subunit [Gammaproteobacteria bacterium]|nr:efflux RND transporter periplasmic adaptor subunit [Gammaproteobacteria bacterium]MBU1979146.1 efflux RND transporter periplasmic adaptor subunit [Gammaproteobacteria bacterium]